MQFIGSYLYNIYVYKGQYLTQQLLLWVNITYDDKKEIAAASGQIILLPQEINQMKENKSHFYDHFICTEYHH